MSSVSAFVIMRASIDASEIVKREWMNRVWRLKPGLGWLCLVRQNNRRLSTTVR